MKKHILITTILILLLCASFAYAQDFEFETEAVRSEIDAGESAQFLIKITNNLKTIREYRIYSMNVEWEVPTKIIKAYPETETVERLVIRPTKHIEPGKLYGITLNFKNTATEEIVHTELLEIDVKGNLDVVSSYRPSIRMNLDVPFSVNPKERFDIVVELENQNLLDHPNLTLKISSDLESLQTEQSVNLEPLGNKRMDLTYELDPLQAPGEYDFKTELLKDGLAIESSTGSIEIEAVTPDFSLEQTKKSRFFKTDYIKTFTSSSNIEDTQRILMPTGIVQSWFTDTDPKSEVITREGEKYLAVDLTLSPGDSKEVKVEVNYRIIVYLILLITLISIIYYRYKSPLSIRKGISDVNTKEGGISELKVMIELTNSGKKAAKNVTVTDYVPNIADIENEFSEGTLRPSRIFKHRSKGTVLKWDIDDISTGEDRLISYTIKSKLSIIGNLKMPRAKVQFKKNKKDLISYSNVVEVSS